MRTVDPFPFWTDFKNYQQSFLKGDVMAALSVALMALPQAMAYSFLAELPLSAGIWSAVFGTIFTAAFGQSRFLVSGTTNTVAILILSGSSEILSHYFGAATGGEKELLALKIVLQLVLIIGLFQILAGLLKLGRFTQFTSRSVVVGYMAGAALAIAITQLFPFFGISEIEGYQPIYQQGWHLITHLPSLQIATTLLAAGCLLLLISLYRLSEKIPASALVFLLAGGLVALIHVVTGKQPVALLQDMGPLYSDLPSLSIPLFEWRIITKLIPLAFAITLLTTLEVTTIGRSYTSSKDPPYHDNQEIFGLGVSNFLSAFFGAMPSSGSFSRSALNKTSGANTRFAALLSGVFVFIFVVLLGFFINRIPLAALSALMIFTAYTMVNFKDLFLCVRATCSDACVVIVTLLSALIFTLDVALYIGILLSIVLYLKKAAVPRLVEYAFNNIGKLRPIDEEEHRPDPRVCIVQTEGELFFGASELFQTKLREIAEDESIRVVILQLLNTRHIDASSCLALKHVLGFLKGTHRTLMLSGISPEVWRVLEDSGLLQEIGQENCFPANERLPSEPTRNAYSRAKFYN